jgi:hypothetical protein
MLVQADDAVLNRLGNQVADLTVAHPAFRALKAHHEHGEPPADHPLSVAREARFAEAHAVSSDLTRSSPTAADAVEDAPPRPLGRILSSRQFWDLMERWLAREFEPTAQSIRNWVAQSESNAGRGNGGLTTAEREELCRLRRENRQLRLEREILSKAAAWPGSLGR